MSSIELEGLSRRFGDTTAVDGVDLSIADGEFLVLLGPSGCGKSTLLRMIAGLIPATGGTIRIDGQDVTDVPSRKRDLAMVFQNYALYPHLTVARNLAFPLRLRRLGSAEVAARVASIAERLEIAHLLDRRPKELSGGQRQRVAVGRAMVREPRAFLMDEPLSNLDATLRSATRHELVELHRALGSTFVYVTHDQVEAMTMATRIVVLRDGRVQQIGTPEQIYREPANTFVAGFIGSPPMNLVEVPLDDDGASVRVHIGDHAFPLWPGQTPPMRVTLGIRPDHLTLAEGGPGSSELRIPGLVTTAERLGHETLLHAETAVGALVSRAPADCPLVAGDPVVLSARVEHLHFFSPDSGGRLRWVSDSLPRGADLAHSS